MPVECDLLIHAQWVLPVTEGDPELRDHGVAVDHGRILEVLPSAETRSRYRPRREVELKDHVLFPGLVNAHTHASMALLRGLADDLPLMTWLHEHIWPAEQKWVNRDFVADGTRLAIAEMIRGGTTCFNDMYFFPDDAARVCDAAGMRAVLGMIVLDFPTAWANGPEDYLHRGLEVHDHYRNHHLIRTAFAPHAPYSVSDAPLERVRTLADELGVPIHFHVHETDDEIRMSLEQHGVRPLERLQRLGLLSPALAAVHMTHLNDDEIPLVAESGASVVHCPESNLKLASGFCRVQELLEAGVNVALGTDGAASNNDLDLLGEARTAALLAKGIGRDPSALPASQALRMATLNGAKALGLEQEIGSIEPGKAADLVALDLSPLETQPLYHPTSQLVYASARHQITDVWIAGRQVLRGRELTTLDQEQILADAHGWRAKIME